MGHEAFDNGGCAMQDSRADRSDKQERSMRLAFARELARRCLSAAAIAVVAAVAFVAASSWMQPSRLEAQGSLNPAQRDMMMIERLEKLHAELRAQTELLATLAETEAKILGLLSEQREGEDRR
jgi:phage I-like protein